eukprot:CAMPEP_0114627898 /NCGR_PEP_ID=MMETSP0168-20121206/12538_1 /TAXON_ID=95228 ORGANISM="Vannella sp., Strain DIVA3 517/6/12" /NCGR_SAMPLE_ID=MMETSP0168 /ASSEMBLY_ACC=CAM_ASM_000044 /LENGTH=219 /DNA_ID=CAMNT_0001839255 /DNA_START=25 /DNA_END=681 /DNA_ORIENTATION=+
MQNSLADLGSRLSALQFGKPHKSSAKSSKAVSKQVHAQLVQLAENIMRSTLDLYPEEKLATTTYDDMRTLFVSEGFPPDRLLACEKELTSSFKKRMAVLKSPKGLHVRLSAHVLDFMGNAVEDQDDDDGLYSVSLGDVCDHLETVGFSPEQVEKEKDFIRAKVKEFTLQGAPTVQKKKNELQELKSLFSGLSSPAPTPCNSEATMSEVTSPDLSDEEID